MMIDIFTLWTIIMHISYKNITNMTRNNIVIALSFPSNKLNQCFKMRTQMNVSISHLFVINVLFQK